MVPLGRHSPSWRQTRMLPYSQKAQNAFNITCDSRPGSVRLARTRSELADDIGRWDRWVLGSLSNCDGPHHHDSSASADQARYQSNRDQWRQLHRAFRWRHCSEDLVERNTCELVGPFWWRQRSQSFNVTISANVTYQQANSEFPSGSDLRRAGMMLTIPEGLDTSQPIQMEISGRRTGLLLLGVQWDLYG